MKIKLGRRDQGIGILGGIIILCLLLVFMGGMYILLLHAIHGINPGNTGGGSEATNDLSYPPGVVAVLSSNYFYTATSNSPVAYEIQESTNLTHWQLLTNWVSPDGSYDWQMPIDKTKPCEFFKIIAYGTNQ